MGPVFVSAVSVAAPLGTAPSLPSQSEWFCGPATATAGLRGKGETRAFQRRNLRVNNMQEAAPSF